jgi:hypothetical protein
MLSSQFKRATAVDLKAPIIDLIAVFWSTSNE